MADGLTSLTSGIRLDLGLAQGPAPAQVKVPDVTRLLEAAKTHPGYLAHSERYELRLRNLDGHAVLELKEKNWASRLNNVFSYARRSDERLAASLAVGRLFNLPAAVGDGARMDGAAARAFAAALPKAVSLAADLQAGTVSLPQQAKSQWARGLEIVRARAAGQDIDEDSGLYQPNAQEHAPTVQTLGTGRGFTLFMGDFDPRYLPAKSDEGAGKEAKQFAAQRPGARGIKRALDKLKGVRRQHPTLDLQQAHRNLMTVVGPNIQKGWLASASARFNDKYGAGLSLAPDGKHAMIVDIECKPNDWEWVDVEMSLQGTLSVDSRSGESPQEPPAQGASPLPFHTAFHLRLPWRELAEPDFTFRSYHIVQSSENLGQVAPQRLPRYRWV